MCYNAKPPEEVNRMGYMESGTRDPRIEVRQKKLTVMNLAAAAWKLDETCKTGVWRAWASGDKY